MQLGRLFLLYFESFPGATLRASSLARAALHLGVEAVMLDPQRVPPTDLPRLHAGDMLVGVCPGTQIFELSLWRPGVGTFRRDPSGYIATTSNEVSAVLERNEIPAPKTVYALATDQDYLNAAIDYCGGFPVIVRVAGGSRGVGVIRVDSGPALRSFADYAATRRESWIIREYIEPAEIVRCIVVGDQVISSTRKPLPQDDFRTSLGAGAPEEVVYPPSLLALAIRASLASGWLFTGVDLLVDQSGGVFVLEVNMPHNFVVVEDACGTDIAGPAVTYLVNQVRGCN